MQIQPGFDKPSTLDSIGIIRLNSVRRVEIILQDPDGSPVSIVEEMTNGGTSSRGILNLDVTDISGNSIYSESYYPVVYPDTRRIKKDAEGIYYIDFGEVSRETSDSGTLLFNWTARIDSGQAYEYKTQIFEVIPPWVYTLLARFRLQLDKSFKIISPDHYCLLGYTDAQLLMYLRAGLERISEAQPYPTFLTWESFPWQHGAELLISAGTVSALESQYLLAVDTDIPSYSDSGHSFVITHGTQIKSLYDSLLNSLHPRIREFKLHYVGVGAVGAEFRIGYGWFQVIGSSPPGSIFRGSYANMP